jgi:hypothetical protein
MMCGRARFNADEARRQCREELQQLRSGDPLAHHYRASGVHAVNLKNRFRDIETGLLRQYFPRGTDLSHFSQANLNKIALRLNQRPRKTLGFETPADRLRAVLQ